MVQQMIVIKGTYALIVTICLSVGLYNLVAVLPKSGECEMTYMWPNYMPLKLVKRGGEGSLAEEGKLL